MHRFIGFILFTVGIGTTVHAQTSDTTLGQAGLRKGTPAERAARQLKTMEKQVRLTQDQVLQAQVILINKTVAMDSLQNNPSGDRRMTARTRRDIQQDADQKIKAMLTDDQKPLYEQWKQQMKEKAAARRKGNALNDGR